MMLKLKTGLPPLNHLDIKSFVLSKQLFGAQQVRLQTNAAARVELNGNPNKEWAQARPFEEIPSATVFQMFRHFLPGGNYFKMDSNQLMFGLKRDFGDIFVWPAMMGNPQTLFTHNPHDFERVFRNEGVWPNRPGMDTLKHHRSELRGEFFQGVEGVLSTQGEKWGTFRSAVNPVLMQPKNVKLYLNKMSTVNWEFVERIKEIRDAETLEVPDTFEEEINRWTLESVSVVALDKKLNLLKENRNSPEAKQLFQSLAEQFKLTFELEFQPSLWKYISTPKYKRLMKALDNIQVITSTFVNEAIERLESERTTGGVEKPESEKSVLEKLLKMDKNIGMVMAMDMLMAGVDTTSTTFTGIMLCLAKNPEKQEKLREEILRILPEKNSEFTESSLKNVPYLRACIKEALRIYPLALGNGRVLQNDVVLNGYQVPKCTTVIMVSATLMRNEQHYPRANEFLPERWLRQPAEEQAASECPNALKASSPFIYLPFGFGPRSCIGKRIVEMELELGVSRIIRNFKVEFNHSTDKAFKSLLINVPNIPLKFKFTDI